MSQENVELVMSLWPGPDEDAAQVWRDDEMWGQWREAAAPHVHEDYELVTTGLPGGTTTAKGFDGDRTARLDWLAPFATYRQEIEEAIDCGDRVLLLVRAFGRLEGSTQELAHTGAEVVTFRDGRIARIELYGRCARALESVGLER
jgi:ketosteroid isomerase-like protein